MRHGIKVLAICGLASLVLLQGCAEEEEGNEAPVVSAITASDGNPDPGETITLSCTASDADGDPLSYQWTADAVAIGGNAGSIQWQAPAETGAVTIAVTVSDGTDSSHRTLELMVGRDEFLLLTGVTDARFAQWSAGWMKTPTWVHDNLAAVTVVDLRSAQAFATGHIAGALSATLATVAQVVEANTTAGDDVVLVCDTGQVAAFATMALRMLGHDAYCMKWGMAGWRDDLAGPWDSGISDDYSSVMSNDAGPQLPNHDWPALNTGLASGEAILAARVAVVLAEGFTPQNAINAYEVMDSPGSYHIHNYWINQDYEDIGHIPGSYQLTPGTLTTNQDLSALHPAQTNVLYCWTGQTSAFVGFYLNALGYDLLSLRFGANALMHEDLPVGDNRWPVGGLHLNYPIGTE